MSPRGIDDSDDVAVQHKVADRKPRRSWLTLLTGDPMATAETPHQTINKPIGLAVFASDALSSTAYSTQEMLVVLALAGTAAFTYAIPLSLVIVVLLAIVSASYVQTIHAYPNGGGAYIVARDNLGDAPAAAAGAALLVGYVLTVAVSISSGVAQINSSLPALYPYRVHLSVILTVLVMLINLRGVRESGIIFAIPTYFFVIMIFVALIAGAVQYLTGKLLTVEDLPPLERVGVAQPLTLFLLLRAFTSGTTALTGVEAISNGVPAFREPRSRNAATTLIWMAVLLAVMLVGITFLAVQIDAVPSEEETVISQLARTVDRGRGVLYLMTIAGTAIILVMAANTSFAGFPRLAAILAIDGFLPRQLSTRGSRLVYSRGIVVLTVLSAGFIIAFQASVTALIPLYAIGVFLSFTLSQAGMAHRWWKAGHLSPGDRVEERGSALSYEPGWRARTAFNALGVLATGAVTIVFAVTKFREGAWIVLIVLPALMGVCFRIHRHYRKLAASLSLEEYEPEPSSTRHRVIILISGVHQGTLRGLRYAKLLSNDVTAVHVSFDRREAEKLQRKWETWGEGVRLVILDSPYRLMLEPVLDYIGYITAQRQPNETITIVVPQFVPRHWFDQLLHSQTAMLLRLVMLSKPGVVVTDVPYQVP